MREIKFRIYDEKGRKMIPFDYLVKFALLGLIFTKEIQYKIMQWTGLKDRNGVEVYEGDIINCTSGCPHEVIFKLEHGGNIMGGMPTFYLSGIGEGYQWTGDEEIIGNIYENPELLETKKSS